MGRRRKTTTDQVTEQIDQVTDQVESSKNNEDFTPVTIETTITEEDKVNPTVIDKSNLPPVPPKKMSSRGAYIKPSGEYLECRVVVLRNDIFNRSKREVAIYDIYVNNTTILIKDREGRVLSTYEGDLRRAMKLYINRVFDTKEKGITYTYTVL